MRKHRTQKATEKHPKTKKLSEKELNGVAGGAISPTGNYSAAVHTIADIQQQVHEDAMAIINNLKS